jgi:beta-fructofuranosidase
MMLDTSLGRPARKFVLYGAIVLCVSGLAHAQIQVGVPELAYEIDYFNDHTVVYNPADSLWHVYGIANPQTEFIHLTSNTLAGGNWNRHNNLSLGDGTEIWAPHVVQDDDLYHMFYTRIGNPREIGHLVSSDLFRWIHTSDPILNLTTPNGLDAKNKDPMILQDGDQWIMYYSRIKENIGGNDYWVVGSSISTDFINWSNHQVIFDENQPSDPDVESPFVVRCEDQYYLFMSVRPWPSGGVDVFVSDDPFNWDASQQPYERIFPWHAPEVVRDTDGEWYLTLPSTLMIKIDSLTGEAGLINLSPTDFTIDGYTVTSLENALLINWNSLDDQNAAGGDWLESYPSAGRLSETKESGAITLTTTTIQHGQSTWILELQAPAPETFQPLHSASARVQLREVVGLAVIRSLTQQLIEFVRAGRE